MADEMLEPKMPWWVKAPAWLAAGIVGVPSLVSLLCLGYVFYIQPKAIEKIGVDISDAVKGNTATLQAHVEQMSTFNDKMSQAAEAAQSVAKKLDAQDEVVRDYMLKQIRLQEQTCVNSAKSVYQANKCIDIRNARNDDAEITP